MGKGRNKVVPHADLMKETETLARKILENAPLAIRAMKQATMMKRDG
jgi:1,4-dihydroxy-2-naphthoyl-CoA synthase